MGAAIRAGGRYVRSAPALRVLLGRAAAVMVFASALWALLPVLAREQLELDSGGYGALLAAVGVGALSGAAILPPLRARLSLNALVTSASLVFAAACAGLALADSTMVAVVVLPFTGLAWIAVLSSLNAGAQALLPRWARARGLAYYQLIFMGGQAAGAAVWGLVADRTDLDTAFLCVAAGLATGAVASRRFALRAPELDLTPSRHWPEPHVVIDAPPDAGPVLVTVEYRVAPEREQAFREAMAPVGRSRRRTGAVRWSLYRDATDPMRFVETYVVPTWGEHLRQHEERVTVRDQQIEAAALELLEPGTRPVISHLLREAAVGR
jgi:MFS family permease